MASAVCPRCNRRIEGTVEDIRKHWASCTTKGAKTKVERVHATDNDAPRAPELVELTFFIPNEVTSSLNTMLHEHRGEAYADKERWRNAVNPVLQGFAKAERRRRVRIHRSSKRDLDPDNLWGSVKFLVDAIKDAGALVNDTSAWIELGVTQGWDESRGKGTLVTIGEAHEDKEG